MATHLECSPKGMLVVLEMHRELQLGVVWGVKLGVGWGLPSLCREMSHEVTRHEVMPHDHDYDSRHSLAAI